MYPRREDLTAQGYDAQFGVNALGMLLSTSNSLSWLIRNCLLGPFYLTQLLLPALRTAAKSSPDGKSRVIHTSSFAGRFVDKIEYNTLTDTPARTKAFEYVLYSQSKLVSQYLSFFLSVFALSCEFPQANSFISNEMARRYGDEGVISVSLHPGFLSSDLLRNLSLWQLAMVVRVLTSDSDTRLLLADVTSPLCA